MPIFLYNYSTKQLHGIYESTTAGEWKLNPAGVFWLHSTHS